MGETRPVFVVDDDEDIREVVTMALGTAGVAVQTAKDGAEAIRQLHEGLHPSVILLDLMMPVMDGGHFVAALRKESNLAAIPVVVLSGHSAARQKAAELGASGCLVKPVELDDLLRAVEKFEPSAP
jgi:CheY-like chemotaxis protein